MSVYSRSNGLITVTSTISVETAKKLLADWKPLYFNIGWSPHQLAHAVSVADASPKVCECCGREEP
jgi:hypothetical protein